MVYFLNLSSCLKNVLPQMQKNYVLEPEVPFPKQNKNIHNREVPEHAFSAFEAKHFSDGSIGLRTIS